MTDELKPLSVERVKSSLEEAKLTYYTAQNGDLMTLWEGGKPIFFKVSDDNRLLLVFGMSDPVNYSDEAYDTALRFVNSWNRSQLFGKAFVVDLKKGDNRQLLVRVDDAYGYVNGLVTDAQLRDDSVGSIGPVLQALKHATDLLGS